MQTAEAGQAQELEGMEMTTKDRDRLAVLLAETGEPGAVTASRSVPADSLDLEVRGLGRLTFPVSAKQAAQLCALGRPARYGKGEDTLLDPSVRDTWEIARSRVRVDKRRWDRALRPALDRLGRDLGLAAGCRLEAQLHSLLVYAPGSSSCLTRTPRRRTAWWGHSSRPCRRSSRAER
jgi:hypothetical protein